jgi:hypothetical protein
VPGDIAMNLYIGSVIFIAILGGIVFHLLWTRKAIPSFSTMDLTTIALFCSLLYITILPFKFGLSRIPLIQTFFFSIPYTATLFIGIRLIPRAGTATLIICGHSLLSQIISSGINPLWWPYALLASFALELYFHHYRKLSGIPGRMPSEPDFFGGLQFIFIFTVFPPPISGISFMRLGIFLSRPCKG